MVEAHTPKTEHVRQRYALDVDATSDDSERDYWAARAEFDRWYASALEEAASGAHAALERVRALVKATEPWGDSTDAEWVAALSNILADVEGR